MLMNLNIKLCAYLTVCMSQGGRKPDCQVYLGAIHRWNLQPTPPPKPESRILERLMPKPRHPAFKPNISAECGSGLKGLAWAWLGKPPNRCSWMDTLSGRCTPVLLFAHFQDKMFHRTIAVRSSRPQALRAPSSPAKDPNSASNLRLAPPNPFITTHRIRCRSSIIFMHRQWISVR